MNDYFCQFMVAQVRCDSDWKPELDHCPPEFTAQRVVEKNLTEEAADEACLAKNRQLLAADCRGLWHVVYLPGSLPHLR